MRVSKVKRLRTWLWEEIPSGISVTLLGTHLLALIAVVYVLDRSRSNETKQVLVNTIGESFARFAGTVWPEGPDAPREAGEGIRRFSQFGAWDGLRLVAADGQILSSISAEEVGTRHWQSHELERQWPTALSVNWEDRDQELLERITYRAPLPASSGSEPMFLEGVVRLGRLIPPSAPFTRGTLAIVVASGMLLLVLCRTLQRHFVPLSNIGSNLVRHQLKLREDLSSMRLADESAAVAKAWNQVVRLLEELRDAAGKASAARELNTALQRTPGAALIEATDAVPEGILHVIQGEQLNYANAMARRLLGLQAETSGRVDDEPRPLLSTARCSPTGQKIVEAICSARSKDQFEARSVRVQAEDESTFQVRIMPLLGRNQGSAALVLISDVSQQARVDRAREDFVAHVAHELRTPLTNIQAYAETYAEFDDVQVQSECFNVINKETRRLARLVEEVLSRSQLDLGTMTIRRDDVNLLELLNEALRDLRATAEEKHIQLISKLPSKLPTLFADRDKLAVVFNNLLGNAIKYTPAGGSVTLQCDALSDTVRIHFTDTGIGIAPEHHAGVFQRMFRVDREEVREQTGTGIGLTTAREITRAHGGDIQLASEVDEGSTFTVTLPLISRVEKREG